MPIPSKQRLLKVAKFTVECEPEVEPFVGNCSAIDPVTDKSNEDYIRKQLRDGNDWAWCSITVTAEWGGVTARDSLGCCSYASQRDFERDMLADMKANVMAELHEALTDAHRRKRSERISGPGPGHGPNSGRMPS